MPKLDDPLGILNYKRDIEICKKYLSNPKPRIFVTTTLNDITKQVSNNKIVIYLPNLNNKITINIDNNILSYQVRIYGININTNNNDYIIKIFPTQNEVLDYLRSIKYINDIKIIKDNINDGNNINNHKKICSQCA
jgi:hypothetical protein